LKSVLSLDSASDITASSALGISDTVALSTLDTGFIENSLAALQKSDSVYQLADGRLVLSHAYR
jgi:hypothetical protein